jgi:hypothetical protein
VWLTVSKAPLMSSCRRLATAPWRHAMCIVSTTSLMARSVERSGRLPIWVSGRSPWDSAAAAIRWLITVSRTLPIVLRSEIGRYAPTVCCWVTVFLLVY